MKCRNEDDQISPLASPSVISRTNFVNKITSRGRSQEVNEPASSGGMVMTLTPLSQWLTGLLPSFSLKVSWLSRTFGGGLWRMPSPPSAQIAGILIKSTFLFYCLWVRNWFCKREVAGPDSFGNKIIKYFELNEMKTQNRNNCGMQVTPWSEENL